MADFQVMLGKWATGFIGVVVILMQVITALQEQGILTLEKSIKAKVDDSIAQVQTKLDTNMTQSMGAIKNLELKDDVELTKILDILKSRSATVAPTPSK